MVCFANKLDKFLPQPGRIYRSSLSFLVDKRGLVGLSLSIQVILYLTMSSYCWNKCNTLFVTYVVDSFKIVTNERTFFLKNWKRKEIFAKIFAQTEFMGDFCEFPSKVLSWFVSVGGSCLLFFVDCRGCRLLTDDCPLLLSVVVVFSWLSGCRVGCRVLAFGLPVSVSLTFPSSVPSFAIVKINKNELLV